MHKALARFSMGLLLSEGRWQRRRCTCAGQLQLDIIFYFILLPRRCGRRQHGGRGFGAADITMLTAGVVLGGGTWLLRHTPHTLASHYL